MRLKSDARLLGSPLRRASVCLPSAVPLKFIQSRYSSSSASYPNRIAIVGGGISGLASAHFIAKEFPKSKITLYESQNRLGGWLRSERHKVTGGDVLFEYGPRTLRPGALVTPTLQLIHDLGLKDEVITTPRDAPGAKNRYIYYPDRLNLLNPTNLNNLWDSGLLAGIWNLIWLFFQGKKIRENERDLSIGEWAGRRIDKRIADNIVSAVFHGIYAGDIYNLSMKALLPMIWNLECVSGNPLWGFIQMHRISQQHLRPSGSNQDVNVRLWRRQDLELMQTMVDEVDADPNLLMKCSAMKTSTFAFKNGLQQLVDGLASSLRAKENVEIVTGTEIDSFSRTESTENHGEMAINLSSKKAQELPARQFDFVVRASYPNFMPSVNVMMVNLWYKTPNLVPVRGFGYLIPRSVPLAQNPERALGVIFEHDANPSQDSVTGTKLTLMFGGHWWDGLEADQLPGLKDGKEMAKAVLKRHLGIEDEPDLCKVNMHKDCIPQYMVGYADKAVALSEKLVDEYGGRMRVVGNAFNGVGVNDCIRGAYALAKSMRDGGWRERKSGLEIYTEEYWIPHWKEALWESWIRQETLKRWKGEDGIKGEDGLKRAIKTGIGELKEDWARFRDRK